MGRLLLFEVLGQPRLLAGGHEQAQLGAAPEDVLGAHGPFLAAQVIHFTGIQAGAQVFAQVHRGLPRFSGDWGGFRSWVFTIAHHRMVDDVRRARRRPLVVQSDVAEEAATGDVEAEALDALSDQRLHRLLGTLSDDQRRVLLLRVVADLPLEDAAATLGKTVGAVKSLQHRALASLRRAMDQEEVGHGS